MSHTWHLHTYIPVISLLHHKPLKSDKTSQRSVANSTGHVCITNSTSWPIVISRWLNITSSISPLKIKWQDKSSKHRQFNRSCMFHELNVMTHCDIQMTKYHELNTSLQNHQLNGPCHIPTECFTNSTSWPLVIFGRLNVTSSVRPLKRVNSMGHATYPVDTRDIWMSD